MGCSGSFSGTCFLPVSIDYLQEPQQIIMSEMDSSPSSISDFSPRSGLFTHLFVVVVMAATTFVYS